ncbi:ribulokinase [Devosia insulae DS-56]|uniref:Ribulokinase n=1 Tax=Devosia insulae DS-56 TaxID=1116389 RepID=A0A1E5XQX4_9HYPH|nr:FGGY-family carbohydrate kinase [Devosia insulae]OEO31012.1 ribulokinase [Devosia insulae DS-56]
MSAAPYHLVGVDVGTGSARAGVFTPEGRMLASAKRDIANFHDSGGMVEQSSTDIWNAVCFCVKEAVRLSGIAPASVAGLGFDATCSLVVLGQGGVPLPVGPSEDPERDIIVWMDHRAVAEAERINAIGHEVLRYVGGTISPEMQTPKLLWLSENRPQVFRDAWQFFDLSDFLSWRATGSLVRSSCTVTCKWTYLAHEQRWDPSYFEQVGLGELAREGFVRIGTEVVPPGTRVGGLNEAAATELGLMAGTPVAAGMIDAHAGGIGTVGAIGAATDNLGYVFGTSSCTMTSSATPAFVPGIWGPYFDAMVPGMWLSEGGQSAAGAAIDRLVALHPATATARESAERLGQSLPGYLARSAEQLAGGASGAVRLADGLHVVPEFLGNRAPFADPHARAIIAGLGMDQSEASLVALYIAGLCGIGYGLRQIIETQNSQGVRVKRIVISGGAGGDDLVRQLLADATGLPVVATAAEEPVLLGSAILGGMAAERWPSMHEAMAAMTSVRTTYEPIEGELQVIHAQRAQTYGLLQALMRSR